MRGKAPSIMTASAPVKATVASPVVTTFCETRKRKSGLNVHFEPSILSYAAHLQQRVGGILKLHFHASEVGLNGLFAREYKRHEKRIEDQL